MRDQIKMRGGVRIPQKKFLQNQLMLEQWIHVQEFGIECYQVEQKIHKHKDCKLIVPPQYQMIRKDKACTQQTLRFQQRTTPPDNPRSQLQAQRHHNTSQQGKRCTRP